MHLTAIAIEAGVDFGVEDCNTGLRRDAGHLRPEARRPVPGLAPVRRGRHPSGHPAAGRGRQDRQHPDRLGPQPVRRGRRGRGDAGPAGRLDGRRARSCPRGSYAVIYGDVAPDGAVIKLTGHKVDRFEGPACVFDSEEDAFHAVQDGSVGEGDVIVIRYEGPQGRSGHARDAAGHRRPEGPRHPQRRPDHRRPVLGRQLRLRRRPRLAGSGGRRADRPDPRRRPHHHRRHRPPHRRRRRPGRAPRPAIRPAAERPRTASSPNTAPRWPRPPRAPSPFPTRRRPKFRRVETRQTQEA